MKNEAEKAAPRSDVRVGQKPAEAEGRAERVALLRKGLGPEPEEESQGIPQGAAYHAWLYGKKEPEPPIPDVKILAHEMDHREQWGTRKSAEIVPVPLDRFAAHLRATQCVNIATKEGLEGTEAIEDRALILMDWADDALDQYSDKLDEEIEEEEAKLSKRGVTFHDTPTRRDIRDANWAIDIAEAEGLQPALDPIDDPFLIRVNELLTKSSEDLLILRSDKLAELNARTKRLEETQDVMTDAMAMLLNLTAIMQEAQGITEEEAIDKTGYWGADEP